MGGDNAPLCVLQGAAQAAAEFGDGMELVLLGEEKAIRDCAKRKQNRPCAVHGSELHRDD